MNNEDVKQSPDNKPVEELKGFYCLTDKKMSLAAGNQVVWFDLDKIPKIMEHFKTVYLLNGLDFQESVDRASGANVTIET